MTKQTAALVAVILVVVVAPAGAVAPGSTLADDFDSTDTDTSTVVVAVGSPSTDDGRASLLAANAIAADVDSSVVRVPNGSVPLDVVRTLGERSERGNLQDAIVVGVGDVDGVASAIDQIGEIDIRDQISGDTPADVLKQATLQTWTSSSSIMVTTTTETDTAKASVALSNETAAGMPVVAASGDVESVADALGASTVYVTPGVSQDVRDQLSNAGYTVQTGVNGVSLDQSLTDVSIGLTSNASADVMFVGATRHVYTATQAGPAGVIVGSGDTLSNEVSTKLGNLNSLQDVYVLGNDSVVSDAVVSSISSDARSAANVSRIEVGDYTESYLRESLLVAGYNKAVLTTSVAVSNSNATVSITNIGYSTVPDVDNTSVDAVYDETGIETIPAGDEVGGRTVISFNGEIDPMESRSLTITDGDVDKRGKPDELDYYVSAAGGGAISAGGIVDTFFNQVNGLVGWVQNLVSDVLPGNLSLGGGSGLVLLVGAVMLVLVGVVALRFVRRRSKNT